MQAIPGLDLQEPKPRAMPRFDPAYRPEDRAPTPDPYSRSPADT